MISSGLWERAFGRDPDVVGRTLYVRTFPYVIVGMAPPEFYGMPPIPGRDLWIPMTWIADLATMRISTWVPSPGETQLERRGFRWMFRQGAAPRGGHADAGGRARGQAGAAARPRRYRRRPRARRRTRPPARSHSRRGTLERRGETRPAPARVARRARRWKPCTRAPMASSRTMPGLERQAEQERRAPKASTSSNATPSSRRPMWTNAGPPSRSCSMMASPWKSTSTAWTNSFATRRPSSRPSPGSRPEYETRGAPPAVGARGSR